MTQPAANPAAVPVAPADAPAVPAAPVAPAGRAAPAVPDLAAELAAVKVDAEKWKAFSRKHEANAEQTAKQLEQQQAILKQLAEKAGVQLDGPPDPAKIVEQLTAAQQSAQQRALELAVFRTASAAGGNADALLDSRAFMAKAAALDANDPELAAKVAALVTETVTANPGLATTPVVLTAPAPPQLPAASGGNFSGAPAGARQWTDADVQRARPEELVDAINDGLLVNLGYGRGKKR